VGIEGREKSGRWRSGNVRRKRRCLGSEWKELCQVMRLAVQIKGRRENVDGVGKLALPIFERRFYWEARGSQGKGRQSKRKNRILGRNTPKVGMSHLIGGEKGGKRPSK